MMEQIIIGILFMGSAVFLSRNFWRSLIGSKKCSSGCGGECKAVNFDHIVKQN